MVVSTDASGQQPLRIAFISSSDPTDVRSFSGTPFHMVQALKGHFPDLDVVRQSRAPWAYRFDRIVGRLTGGRVNPYYWRRLNRFYAARLARRWRGRRVLVVAVVNAALVSELAERVPVLNVTDATFALMRGFYSWFDELDRRTAQAAEEMERRSIRLSVHNSFSSRWAGNSAVRDYGADEADVSVIPWGCNIDDVPGSEIRPASRRGDACRLLFIGIHWLRKGGDVVLATGELLAAKSFPFHIDIVGSAPDDGLPQRPWLENHGYLSKADEGQRAKLRALIRDADFLFLPTRQDTYGIVFAEASAYGTPSVTRDVGGVASVVRDGVNGMVLPEDASAEDFAAAIEAAWRDTSRYEALREGARREYEERLNWTSWAGSTASVIARLDAERRI
jgi:glycosyltransferase involved in cell wall biosynthesis